MEGRGKIAFDPRDYENGSMGGERERMPRLTVMEEVLLLGLKDKQVRVWSGGSREGVVLGDVLVDDV